MKAAAAPSIYSLVIAAGVAVDNHESDLYVPANDTTKAILEGYEFRSKVTTFRSAVDHGLWYDIPFAYDPFWSAR